MFSYCFYNSKSNNHLKNWTKLIVKNQRLFSNSGSLPKTEHRTLPVTYKALLSGTLDTQRVTSN